MNIVGFFFLLSICSKVFERSCVLCCNPLQWLPEFQVFALVVRQLWRAMSLWKSWATVWAALPLSERRNLPSHHWRMLLPCWMDGKKLHTGWRSGGQRESDWENKRQRGIKMRRQMIRNEGQKVKESKRARYWSDGVGESCLKGSKEGKERVIRRRKGGLSKWMEGERV